MMKSHFSVAIFMLLLLSSMATGIGSYNSTKAAIVADLNRALAQTLTQQDTLWLSQDTISAYRTLQSATENRLSLLVPDNTFCRNLGIRALKSKAFLSLAVAGQSDGRHILDRRDGCLCSDTAVRRIHNSTIWVRGYASCSPLMVYGLSDQRLSWLLLAAAFGQLLFTLLYSRRRKTICLPTGVSVGNITFSAQENRFYTHRNTPIHLTPMQHRLLEMFFMNASHRLSKQEICTVLWHGKDEADDTLYTLIRRMKPVLEQHSNLRIVSDRSKGYELTCGE